MAHRRNPGAGHGFLREMHDPRDRSQSTGTEAVAAAGRQAITRRRALLLGASAGLASLLSPARSAPAFAARPARVRGFGLTVTPADFGGGRTSRVLRAPRRFDLIGVRGAGRVEVRVRRRGGSWSRWIPLSAHGDHAPDTGTGDRASDPVWTGGSHEMQLRLARPAGASLRVHMVAVPVAARRRASARSARVRARAAQAAPGTPPPIIPRSAWGGDSVPPRSAPSYGSVQVAFIHHTVTANEYTPQDSAAIVLGIAKYHRDTNGWNDIGYNFLIDQYGQVFEGRAGGVDQPVVGAQAQGYNSQSTGIAHLGTFTATGISEAAMAATAQLLGWKMSLHGVPTEGTVVLPSGGGSLNRYPAGTPVTFQRISGHRDGDATTCPGDALYAQLPALRARATALAGPIAAPSPGQVTLSVDAPAVPYGQPAGFRGVVTMPGGAASAGTLVDVQKRGTTGAWVTLARVAAGADGTWAAAVPWRRSGQVRARAATGVTSPVTDVAVVASVTVRLPSRRRIRPGSVVRLGGEVRPAQPMRVLVEFQGRNGAWHRVRVVRARVGGTSWGTSFPLRRPGLYRLTPRTAQPPATRVQAGQVLIRVVRR
jgi:hypothetical protein